ncbi:MAG: hypothetical protein ACI8WB_000770 [Phenylobacterium sp.]|jgi:hypothetical protein
MRNFQAKPILTLLFVMFLTACGGGGNTATAPTTPTTPPTAPPTSTPEPTPIPASLLPGPRPEFGPRDYVLFESAQVRPLAKSADGQLLYAVNTPDNRLEIYQISDSGLTHLHSVPVGMEPVAVASADANEVWVVNHMSDSISVIRFDPANLAIPPQVVKTLLVGDEPET